MLGALIDRLLGGGNGATLGACSPARRGRLDELVPGRTNAGVGRNGALLLTEEPANEVSASHPCFFSRFLYVPQLLPKGRDTDGSFSTLRFVFDLVYNCDCRDLKDLKMSRIGVPCRSL
jgi:hypothetical protein